MYCMFFRVFVKIPCLHHTFSVYEPSVKQALSSPEVEDITWPRGDMKFLLESWKKNLNINIHSKRNFVHVPPSKHAICSDYTVLYKHQ